MMLIAWPSHVACVAADAIVMPLHERFSHSQVATSTVMSVFIHFHTNAARGDRFASLASAVQKQE